jgi:hypothetical protein
MRTLGSTTTRVTAVTAHFSVRVAVALAIGALAAPLSVGATEGDGKGKPRFASFEEAAAAARPVADLAALVEPFFADCGNKDQEEHEQRQCAAVRDALVDELRTQSFIAVGDGASVQLAPYDASEKEIEANVVGCLACGRPLAVDGQQRFLTTRVPKAIKGGHASGLDVATHELPFADGRAADRFLKHAGSRLRSQFVFRLGSAWKSASFEGLSFVPEAHRIFDPCTGTVLASDPPSAERAPTLPLRACKEGDLTPEEQAQKQAHEALPEQLSRQEIERALAPVQEKVHECYAEFEEQGTVHARMVVDGEGRLESIAVMPPFDKTPTGYCVRTAAKTAVFPHFKGEKMTINYGFYLR